MRKSTGHLLLAVLVTALLVGSISYLYADWAGYNEGFRKGSAAVVPVAVIDEASISVSLNSTTFDHTSTVASDGSVATQTSVSLTFYINNTDDELTAYDISVRLKNPKTDTEGLHDNLETDSTEFGVTEGGTTTKLFHDGDYVEDGWSYGDLGIGGALSITVTFTLETAVAGTFQDAQTYSDQALYVYQAKANSVDKATFSVTT